MSTRLVLVRHGESRAMVDRIVAGVQSCGGLTELGRRHAAALRDRLQRTRELSPSVIYTSSMLRARETGAIVSEAFPGVEVREDCDVCELHIGEGEGLGWEDFVAAYGPWRASEDVPVSPGSESYVEFFARAGGALRRIADEHQGETVIVACHGGVVEASFRAFADGAATTPLGYTDYTSLTEWAWIDTGPPARPAGWYLARYNDAAHLHDVR